MRAEETGVEGLKIIARSEGARSSERRNLMT